jgi:hypothetical protein
MDVLSVTDFSRLVQDDAYNDSKYGANSLSMAP